MKKLFLSTLLLALPLLASAYDIAVKNADGVTIFYNYINNGTELAVVEGNCSRIVNIPEEVTYMSRTRKVTTIGNRAFSGCYSLASVTIPNSVTYIGDSAFEGCTSLTSITIPNSVTTIRTNTFYNCINLTTLSIGNSVTTIGDSAISGCTSLTSVTIGNSVTSIGNYAFSGCTSLTSITIPISVTSIGDYAFSGCRGLTSVTIPNSVTSIGNYAFQACTNLTSVTIPNSVTSIGSCAFEGCSSLTSVTIPNSVTSIGSAVFYQCRGLTSVTIPNSVTSIGERAFYACSSLTSVTIPNSVTSIGNAAFSYCSGLTSVTIPNSVTSIGYCAFSGCTGLTSVISKMENPCFYNVFFDKDVLYNATLYVPKGTSDKYKSMDGWKKFVFIEEGEPGSSVILDPKKCATPIITYSHNCHCLVFLCDTEGVEYFSEIKDADIKKYYVEEIDLTATYEISVYATKSGYENSDVATATLVWTDAVFTETTPSASSAKAIAESIPMLISAQNGTIVVRGEQDGLPLTVYSADGKMLGAATIKNGQASISTNLQRGEIAIVKIGSKSVKIKM